MSTLHELDLHRFRKDYYASAVAREKENRRIEKLIAVANCLRIKPRVIVQAETRKSS